MGGKTHRHWFEDKASLFLGKGDSGLRREDSSLGCLLSNAAWAGSEAPLPHVAFPLLALHRAR